MISNMGLDQKRSCLSQLLRHYNEILKGMEEGSNVDYLAFSKAFYKVDIGMLMHKMGDMDVHGRLASWIHSFLTDRKQVITANGANFTVSEASSEVSQCPVLGPFLFLIMINDKSARKQGLSSAEEQALQNKCGRAWSRGMWTTALSCTSLCSLQTSKELRCCRKFSQ